MNEINVFDERFHSRFANVHIDKLATGAIWSEGPVWLGATNTLVWSDIPNNRMLCWNAEQGMSVWRSPANFTNGHTLEADGSLLHCSHGARAIIRTRVDSKTGRLKEAILDEIVVDRFEGKRLNSPNDIVVKSDGSIWFTDPPYGILSNKEGYQAESELGINYVFCFDPKTQTLTAVSHFVDEPNGLAFSPDESVLYVSDTAGALREGGNHHIVAFDVHNNHSLSHPRIFAVIEPGLPDGFRIDSQGWLYTSSRDSVQVFAADGKKLAKIPIPEKVGNLCFKGNDQNTIFVCASQSVYRLMLTPH
jgi:gluconolactonase